MSVFSDCVLSITINYSIFIVSIAYCTPLYLESIISRNEKDTFLHLDNRKDNTEYKIRINQNSSNRVSCKVL